jgi:hypothetical protein
MPFESKAQSPAKVSITHSTTQLSSAKVGSIIEVPLTVENIQNLFGWNLNLTWNPQVLNLTDIKEGSFLSNAGSTMFLWGPSISMSTRNQGYINCTSCFLLDDTSASGNGVLATLSFQVLNAGTSPISIEGTVLFNPSPLGDIQYITATLNSGTITITSLDDNSDNNLGSNKNGYNDSSHKNTATAQKTISSMPNFVLIMVIIVASVIIVVGILFWFKKPPAQSLKN